MLSGKIRTQISLSGILAIRSKRFLNLLSCIVCDIVAETMHTAENSRFFVNVTVFIDVVSLSFAVVVLTSLKCCHFVWNLL